MTKAFISYARADEDAARRFARELERRGIRETWMDRIVAPGQAWTSQLETAISESDLFFVLVSRESSRSQWVAAETALAISMAEEGRTRVIPVLLDREAEVPALLSYVQGLEFFDPERSQKQLDVLIRSIDRGRPTERDRTLDLEAQLRYVKASREALSKEISIQASRRAVWSSTIAAATTALAAVAGILAGALSVADIKVDSLIRWALPFGLGVLASVLGFILTAYIRRRDTEREKQ